MLRKADNANGKQSGEVPDPEILVRARRNRISAVYKLRWEIIIKDHNDGLGSSGGRVLRAQRG